MPTTTSPSSLPRNAGRRVASREHPVRGRELLITVHQRDAPAERVDERIEEPGADEGLPAFLTYLVIDSWSMHLPGLDGWTKRSISWRRHHVEASEESLNRISLEARGDRASRFLGAQREVFQRSSRTHPSAAS